VVTVVLGSLVTLFLVTFVLDVLVPLVCVVTRALGFLNKVVPKVVTLVLGFSVSKLVLEFR
jgi:hypothetical protein